MISEILGAAQLLSYRIDDDYIDRLHYFLTSNLLVALSLLVSFKQFGGKPIECMTPKMYPDSWEDYAENFCWAQDTFYLPMSTKVMSNDPAERYQSKIAYYQWVPFFLLFCAACFRLPSIVWKYMAGHSGIQIHDIVGMATDRRNLEPEARKANLHSLTVHLQNALRFHRRLVKKGTQPHKYLRPFNFPYNSFYVTGIYILIKFLYFGNVLIQLFLMNWFLGTATGTDQNKKTYDFYGFEALADIMRGKQWDTSGVFPRISYCDFDIRMMGSNVQRYSVQCVLVINIFNEKIFVFLWFWYLCLLFLTFLSMAYWMVIMAIPHFSRWFVSRNLEFSELPFDPKESGKDVERFVHGYLKTDGLFVLRMINIHAGIIFSTELTSTLWKAFYHIEDIKRRQSSQLTPSPLDEKDAKLRMQLDNTFNVLRLRKNLGQKAKESKNGGTKSPSTKSNSSSKKKPLSKTPPDSGTGTDGEDSNAATDNDDDNNSESAQLLEILVPNDRGNITASGRRRSSVATAAAMALPAIMIGTVPLDGSNQGGNTNNDANDVDDDDNDEDDDDDNDDDDDDDNDGDDDNDDDDDKNLSFAQLTSLAMLQESSGGTGKSNVQTNSIKNGDSSGSRKHVNKTPTTVHGNAVHVAPVTGGPSTPSGISKLPKNRKDKPGAITESPKPPPVKVMQPQGMEAAVLGRPSDNSDDDTASTESDNFERPKAPGPPQPPSSYRRTNV